MGTRFDDFISGRSYQFDGFSAHNHSQFLRFEIGKLLGLLTCVLDSPSHVEDDWGRIIEPLLKRHAAKP